MHRTSVWLLWPFVLQATVFAAPITHVVHVSLDGLGSSYLQNYLAHGPKNLPSFARLVTESAYTFNARCDYFASETIPNHACMFTGRPVGQPQGFPNTVHHGFTRNAPLASDTLHAPFNPAVPYKASFMDVAHDHGLSTAFYASKMRLSVCDRSYDEANGALDLIEGDNGRDKIDFAFINEGPISAVVDLLVEDLSSSTPKNYSFIHLREPDITGHNFNWGSAAYSNAVVDVDRELGRIFAAIDQNTVLSNHTIMIVVSDHGGGGVLPHGHSEPEHVLNYTIPFFLWGPPIPAGANLYTLFANRADPGTSRVPYHVNPQPIRNGDGANIGLGYLGLPAIPGSFMIPQFAGPRLLVQREASSGAIKVAWSAQFEGYTLQGTSSLTPPVNWQSVAGVTEENGFFCHRLSPSQSPKFFRLRLQ